MKISILKLLSLHLTVLLLSTQIIGQTTTLQFSLTNVPTGNGPRSAVLIDLDRDGVRDLVVANLIGSTISMIYGDEYGSFTLIDGISSVHKAPHAIAVGDFDENGLFDFITANRDDNTIGIFLNDGAGSFLPPSFITTGDGPRWIAVADFNEDNHSDLAVTNRTSDDVTILLGDGSGGFSLVGNFYTGDGPVPLIAADLDGDGLIDLAVANDLSDILVILSGDGTGSFSLLTKIQVGLSPKHISVGDLNQDGISDLVVASLLDGNVTVLIADGFGSFTSSTYAATAGAFAVVIEDFDGDGNNDLAVADGVNDVVAILLGDGRGNFSEPQNFPVGLAPHALISGDFNGDGRPDLATPNTGDDTITILLNETPSQSSVHEISIIQMLYSDFFPDPVISPVNVPLRFMVTTNSREHVNRLRLLPFISSTDIVRVEEILNIEFTPDIIGTFQIQNIGHGFTGDIIITEGEAAADAKVIELNRQGASLIHSNAQTQIFPATIRVLKDIPLTIYNISLDDEHWVSIEPWVTAPDPSEQGNVRTRVITKFEFTPTDTGRFEIVHTVHGFSGQLIVANPVITGLEPDVNLIEGYSLNDNYPNPFNPSTTIEYIIPQAGSVSLIVYNLLGEEVTRLVDEIQQADKYNIIWEASNFSSGIYFYQLQAGKFVQTNKMLLLK
ncbi:T9SS type A sorting domain-containing protein [Candidatus Marinimicrobia bacterium MT.SAG.3]|nr:T9SS type A sorting domain-containing protein [Candidatus Marinimicrobia bacterium MT.SAG.3]